jgi:ornithine cyclodeaminase
MPRIFRDRDVDRLADRRNELEQMEAGYRADAQGGVLGFPRTRAPAAGVTLAWMGAAIPGMDVLGYRSYLYDSKGSDRGDQIVALYRYSTMELKALFLGRRIGILRTGAAVGAALHLAQPDLRSLGLLGTGTQARQVLRCAASTFRLDSVWAWSPNIAHRTEFQVWAEKELHVRVELGESAHQVLSEVPAIVLATSSEQPIVTPEVLPGPRLLVSISAYRRPEIALSLLDAAPRIWTDSRDQAGGRGTLFEDPSRYRKLRPLASEEDAAALRDSQTTRIIINTGAAWEEVLLAESLWQTALPNGGGVDLEIEREPTGSATR